MCAEKEEQGGRQAPWGEYFRTAQINVYSVYFDNAVLSLYLKGGFLCLQGEVIAHNMSYGFPRAVFIYII